MLHYSLNGESFETSCFIQTAKELLDSSGYDSNSYYLIESWQSRGHNVMEKLKPERKIVLRDGMIFYARLVGSDHEKSTNHYPRSGVFA